MKKVLSVILIFSLLLVVGCSSQGKKETNFPAKPITLVVPYAAGGGVDQVARMLEKIMPKYLPNGQSIVIVNNAAGANIAGTTEVFKAKPDGYTLEFVAAAPLSITPLYGNTPYTHDSFQAIIKITSVPQALAVKADAPWKNFDEWLAYVKQNPVAFAYGSAGNTSAGNIAMQPLITDNDLKVKHVSFNGGSPAITAVLGGHTQGIATSAQEVKNLIESGQLRVLVNLGTIKPDHLKDVPTLKEKGLSNMGNTYYGIIGPKKIPKEIVTVIHDAFKKTMEDPEFIKQLKNNGASPDYAGPDEFQKEITDSYKVYEKILKGLGAIK